MFEFLARYFWIAGIVTAFINITIFRFRAKKHFEQEPQLKDEYTKLLNRYLFWLSLPWVVMGIGIVFGGVPTLFHYFRPQDGNPFVLAWFATIFLIWVLGTYWLFFKNGAETLQTYHILTKSSLMARSPLLMKIYWLLCLVGGIIGVSMMWRFSIPIHDISSLLEKAP